MRIHFLQIGVLGILLFGNAMKIGAQSRVDARFSKYTQALLDSKQIEFTASPRFKIESIEHNTELTCVNKDGLSRVANPLDTDDVLVSEDSCLIAYVRVDYFHSTDGIYMDTVNDNLPKIRIRGIHKDGIDIDFFYNRYKIGRASCRERV